MVEEGPIYYAMLNTEDLRRMTEFAAANLARSGDDRIILLTQETGVGTALWVASVPEFFARADWADGHRKSGVDVNVKSVPDCATAITDRY